MDDCETVLAPNWLNSLNDVWRKIEASRVDFSQERADCSLYHLVPVESAQSRPKARV